MKMVLMSVSVRQLSLLGCLLVLLAVTGCASTGSASSTSTHGELTVVTAFYPLQFVAQHVAGAHGAVTGLYSLSRGVGTSLGPLLAGVAIEAAGEDYRWTWLVCGAAILVSIPVMAPVRDERRAG